MRLTTFQRMILVGLMMACLGSNMAYGWQSEITLSDDGVVNSSFPTSVSPGPIRFKESREGNWNPESFECESPYSEPLETDRHDFTQSTGVVGRRVLQLEYGFLYSFKDEEGEQEDTYTTPELLVRFGLTDRLEIRSRWNLAWKDFSSGENIAGFLDPLLSLKYQVTDHAGLIPKSALELRTSAPLGSESLSLEQWKPGFDFIYGWEFGEFFSLAGSTGATSNGLGDIAFIDETFDPEDQFVAWTQSVALGAELTRRTTGYFEWFGIFANDRDEAFRTNYLNLGVDYLLNNNMVVDVRFGWGLNNQSDDIFAGVGGAVRF